MNAKIENHWGKWVNSEIAITGVAQNNHIEWLNDEIASGIDLSYELYVKELDTQLDDGDISQDDYEESLEWYENTGDSTYLIGNWIKDEDGKYAPDITGEYAAICSEIYTQVVYSKFTKRCALCSPCYPGQGDLDTPGAFLTYDLPPTLYGDMNG